MGKVNVIVVDATGNKEQKVGLPDDIKCGIIMVKLVEKIKLPSVGPDGNPISYKFIHKVTGRQLLETQTLAEAGVKNGDVLRLQPEITAGAFCDKCGAQLNEGDTFCPACGNPVAQQQKSGDFPQYAQPAAPEQQPAQAPYQPAPQTPYQAPAAAPVSAEQKVQAISGKASKRTGLFSIGGIISGIISIIFGIIMFQKNTGYSAYAETYGGDAYTGIQNAAVRTANNVQMLGEIVKDGLGFLLIAIGLVAVFYFALKLGKSGDNK